MSPTLFFTPGSCAFGSIVTLEWLGLPYRLTRLTKEMHDDPAFRRISPAGEVPALEADGKVLTESLAILQHLGSRRLERGLTYAQGTPEFDRLNQVLAYLVSAFHPAFKPIFHPDRLASGEAAQEIVYNTGVAALPGRYAQVESMIGAEGWLAGDHATVADAYFYGLARWGDDLLDTKAYPKIVRLRERLAADPAVQFAHAIEEGREANSTGAFEGFAPLEDARRSGFAA